MLSKHLVKTLLAASALVVGSLSLGNAAEPFALSSTTFKDGTMMPKEVANKNPANPNCVGENVSPELTWTGVPEGTKSLALTMVDPEGRGGLGVFHWVAYGIPPNVTLSTRAKSARPATSMSAARAPRASATTPARAPRPARRTTTPS